VALLRAIPAALATRDSLTRPDERIGAEVIARALEEPARWIALNAGAEGASIVADLKARTDGAGFNAATGRVEDLAQAGVLDPAKVVRVALAHAASIGSLVLTAEALVVDQPDKEQSHE
jgi:chaperonin GroEL